MTKSIVLLSMTVVAAFPQDTVVGPSGTISLIVPAGVPLRLYLTKRIPKRIDAPVEARLLTPVYAFDQEVIPMGAQVFGRVSRLQPVSKWDRARAVLGGDFTPLHIAQIEFTSLQTSNGQKMELHTIECPGLRSLVPLVPLKKRSQSGQTNNGGKLAEAKQKTKDAMQAQIARIKSIPEIVRGPGKKEMLYDFAMSKLPYHPQYVHSRTRIDAELQAPLDFGSKTVTQASLYQLGSQPAPGSIAHARLLTPLHSMSSKQGDKVQAVLEQPLFSADRRLVLPQGTLVEGSVTMVKRAKWFHRGGHLRFNFLSIELSRQVAELMASPAALKFRTQATLHAAEGGHAPLKVDKEGGVQATESKTRFIGTAVALLLARSAADRDHDHPRGVSGTGQNPNITGRTLGGGLGFGLLGSIASQSSPNVGAAFGYYGMAWAVYSTVFARGAEVEFGKNAVIDIGFNQRAPIGTAKIKAEGAETK